MLFRPEFVPTVSDVPTDLAPGRMLERMPDHIVLDQKALLAVKEAILTIAEDARSDALVDIIHTLLRYRLCTLILRRRDALLARSPTRPPKRRSRTSCLTA